MFHVYTIKNGSDFSKTLVGEFKDFEEAMDCAENSVAQKEDLKYIVEETTGHVNSYGDLEVTVIAKS